MEESLKNKVLNIMTIKIREDIKEEVAEKCRIVVCRVLFFIAGIAFIGFSLKSHNPSDLLIIGVILLLILGCFSWFYSEMVDKYIKIKLQLKEFNKNFENICNITDFTENYYDIKEALSKIPHISDIWREFCETLIPVKENNEIVRYKNTAQTELYINKETIINQQVTMDKFDSIPGILTGLGLVGTFTAITFALMGFNLIHLEGSVENLLSGLSIKFISSLAGIMTSISFIFIKDHLFGTLETELVQIQIKLNRIFPRRTTESFLNDILLKIEEQSISIKEFLLNAGFQEAIKKAMSLGLEDLKPQFANINNAINISLETMQQSKTELFEKLDSLNSQFSNSIDNLNNSITNSLSGAISDSLKNLTGDFGSAIQELKIAMEDFKNMKQESSASLIQNMINELKECIMNMQNSLTDAVVGGSGDTIANLQRSIIDASDYLSSSQEMYNNFIQSMQEQMANHSIERDEAVNRVIGQTIDRVSSVNDMVQNSMKSQDEKMNEWLTHINSYISEIHNNEMNVKNNYSELLIGLNQAIDRQRDVTNNNSQFINSLIDASNQLNGSTDNILTAQQTLSSNLNSSSDVNVQFIEKLKEFNELNNDVNNSLCQNIKLIENQSSVYEGINEITTRLMETLIENINDFANKSQAFQNQVFEELSSKLSQQIGGLNSVVQQQKEIVEELVETHEEFMNR